MADDERAKREIQENFSQRLYTIHRKIELLREELKISEASLTNAEREQIRIKNAELQTVLNSTHA